MSADESDSEAEGSRLERQLGFRDILMFGVGGMLGAGIYAIVGEVTADAGNLLWLSLLIASIVAVVTSLTYAELVSTFPDAGRGYEYIAQAFGRRAAAAAAVLLLLTGVVAAAAISIAFANYLGRLVDWPQRAMIAAVLVLVTAFNVRGVGQSSWFNIAATLVTAAGLALVVGFGVPRLGAADLLAPAPAGLAGVMAGAALAFFSYVGFEDLVKLAEEAKEPRRTVPRALVLSACFVSAIYVLVAVTAVSIVDHGDLAAASGPLAAVMRAAWGPVGATAITVIALFATSKTVLTNVMGNARLVMDVARDHDRLGWLAYVAPRVHTPVVALGLIFVLTLAFAMIGNLGVVATISNLCIFVAYIVVNAGLIKIRVSRRDVEPGFRVPLSVCNIPVLPCVSIFLLLALIVASIPNLTGW